MFSLKTSIYGNHHEASSTSRGWVGTRGRLTSCPSSCPILSPCAMWLCTGCCFTCGLYFFTPWPWVYPCGLFGQWDVNTQDASKGLKCVLWGRSCLWGFCLHHGKSFLREPLLLQFGPRLTPQWGAKLTLQPWGRAACRAQLKSARPQPTSR